MMPEPDPGVPRTESPAGERARPVRDRFGRVLAALLVGRLILGLFLAHYQAVTMDEPDFIAAGLAGWQRGDWAFEQQNPTLGKLAISVPWLVAGARTPSPDAFPAAYAARDHYALGRNLLFAGERARLPLLLFSSRAIVVLLTTAALAALVLWLKRRAGTVAATWAAAIACVEPNLLAHGSLATLDALSVAGIVTACLAFEWALACGRWRAWLLTGMLVGVAVATKYSALLLGPVFLARALWWRIGDLRPGDGGILPSERSFLLRALAAGGLAVLVLWGAFGFRSRSLGDAWSDGRHAPGLTFPALLEQRRVPPWLRAPLTDWRLPLADPLLGIARVREVAAGGRMTFLDGRIYPAGTRWFSFWIFLWKTPLLILFGLAGAVVLTLRDPGTERPETRGGANPRLLRVLLFYFALWLLFPFTARNAFAYRYLMACVPFAIACAGIALARCTANRRWRTGLAGAAVGSLLLVTPHQFAFFNLASRAAGPPHRLAVDSNMDLGQGLRALAALPDRVPEIRDTTATIQLALYTPGDPDYIRTLVPALGGARVLDPKASPPPAGPFPLVVSATEFAGMGQFPASWFDTLRGVPPDGVIAGQYLVWLRGK